ncbi:MAG: ChbG/HpnK family deacetylase [Chloroflexota bacterium]
MVTKSKLWNSSAFENYSLDGTYMHQMTVTCDDCGLSEGINLATIDLYQAGFVTAASLMTNFPAFNHALNLFVQYPSLELGIHLNLTDGFPLTSVPINAGLTNSKGHFCSRFSLFYNALFPTKAFLDAVEIELAAQIEKVIDVGIQPQHLTTHLHFHMFPFLRRIVWQHAKHYKISWIRAYRLSTSVVPFNPFLDKALGSVDSIEKTPDYLVVLKYWVHQDLHRLKAILDERKGIIELVVHPSLRQDASYPTDVNYKPSERFVEVQTLQKLFGLLKI